MCSALEKFNIYAKKFNVLLSEFTLSCNFSEDLYNIFSWFCKPTAISERRMSSANNSINISTKVGVSIVPCLPPLIISHASSFMYNKNKIGPQTSPCFTPHRQWMLSMSDTPSCTHAFTTSYIHFTHWNNLPQIPCFSRIGNNSFLERESNAFWKSINVAYSLRFKDSCFCTLASKVNIWSTVE